MPTNDSTSRVLEGFLAALLRHHGETSCVDTDMEQSSSTPIKVNLIFDNCAMHQTQRETFRKNSSGCTLRTRSFEVPTPVVEKERLLPRSLCRNNDEKGDTSPLMPRSYNKKFRSHSEEQDHGTEIPKQSLHQSWTATRRMASTTTYQSCSEAAAVAAAVLHCKSRWSSSPMTASFMKETSNANHQRRPFPVERHDVQMKFPTPPHPAKRQVSVDSENSAELATSVSSRHHDVMDDLAEDEESMMQEHVLPNSSLPNKKDCNIIALVDQALHAMATSFPDAAVQRDRKTPYHVMKCHHHSHSLVALPDKKWH